MSEQIFIKIALATEGSLARVEHGRNGLTRAWKVWRGWITGVDMRVVIRSIGRPPSCLRGSRGGGESGRKSSRDWSWIGRRHRD